MIMNVSEKNEEALAWFLTRLQRVSYGRSIKVSINRLIG